MGNNFVDKRGFKKYFFNLSKFHKYVSARKLNKLNITRCNAYKLIPLKQSQPFKSLSLPFISHLNNETTSSEGK